jgi:hypothetical protein
MTEIVRETNNGNGFGGSGGDTYDNTNTILDMISNIFTFIQNFEQKRANVINEEGRMI